MQTEYGNLPVDPSVNIFDVFKDVPFAVSQERYAELQEMDLDKVKTQVKNRSIPTVAFKDVKGSTQYINMLGMALRCAEVAGYKLVGIEKQ